MLETKKKCKEYLTKIEAELQVTNISLEKNEQLKNLINNLELTVPVVGEFSSGKSTLINSFLGKSYLPVGILPETALATELRYSESDYIEAVRKDNSLERFEIDEIEKIKNNAQNYKYMKFYLNNDKLKQIYPLILVDMPGFDSPLDLHNQAIMEYLNKGVYYIVLTSADNGSITRSMIRQIEDIKEYERDFSFFLSKTNLRAESEVDDIAKLIEEQINDHFDINKRVEKIGKADGGSLENILKGIDPEKLFKNLVLDELKSNYFGLTELLNSKISSLQRSKDENEKIIAELEKGISLLLQRKEKMLHDAQEKYSVVNTDKIIINISKELSSSVEQLVDIYISSGNDGLTAELTEIIRHTLIREVKEIITITGEDIINEFASEMKAVTSVMSEITMNDDWLSKFTDGTQRLFNTGKGLEKILVNNKDKINKTIFKTISTILAVTTSIVAPIIEVIIIFLPEIIGFFLKGSQKRKQREEVRKNILTVVIPDIKRNLRSKLPDIFSAQVNLLINQIGEKFEMELTEKQNSVKSTTQEKEEANKNVEEEIVLYKGVHTSITCLANNLLFAGNKDEY